MIAGGRSLREVPAQGAAFGMSQCLSILKPGAALVDPTPASCIAHPKPGLTPLSFFDRAPTLIRRYAGTLHVRCALPHPLPHPLLCAVPSALSHPCLIPCPNPLPYRLPGSHTMLHDMLPHGRLRWNCYYAPAQPAHLNYLFSENHGINQQYAPASPRKKGRYARRESARAGRNQGKR